MLRALSSPFHDDALGGTHIRSSPATDRIHSESKALRIVICIPRHKTKVTSIFVQGPMVRPTPLMISLSRSATLLSHAGKATEPTPQLRFGPFCLDPLQARLRRGEEVVALRPRAFAVLAYLVARPGHLVTREELLQQVWWGVYVSDSVVAPVSVTFAPP